MGAGLALKIAKKWPAAKGCYAAALYSGKHLGDVAYGMSGDGLKIIVAHLFAQDKYGRGQRHTDYEALASCLTKLQLLGSRLKRPVYLPYGLGCGLAGGDWDIVSKLIEDNCPDAIICKLPRAIAQ